MGWQRWLVTFNATKRKLLSYNHRKDPLLVPVEMKGIELPEETSLRLIGLTFIQSMDWKPYIQFIAKAASRKMGSIYRAQHFLTLESILYLYKSTIWPCMEYCSHTWGGAPRSSAETGNQLSRLRTFFWFSSPVTQEGYCQPQLVLHVLLWEMFLWACWSRTSQMFHCWKHSLFWADAWSHR